MVNLFKTRIGISPVLPDLITDPVDAASGARRRNVRDRDDHHPHLRRRKRKDRELDELKDAQAVAEFRDANTSLDGTAQRGGTRVPIGGESGARSVLAIPLPNTPHNVAPSTTVVANATTMVARSRIKDRPKALVQQGTNKNRRRADAAFLEVVAHSLCEFCDTFHAKLWCKNCAKTFCERCSAKLHASSRRKHHKLEPYHPMRSGAGTGSGVGEAVTALSASRPLDKILASARKALGRAKSSLSIVTMAQREEHGQRTREKQKREEEKRKMNQEFYARPAELDLADAFIERGRLEEAAKLLQEALHIQHARFGDETVPVAATNIERAKLCIGKGQPESAIAIVKNDVLNVVAANERSEQVIELDVEATEVIAKALVALARFQEAREVCEDKAIELGAGSTLRLRLRRVIDSVATAEKEQRAERQRRADRRANPFGDLDAGVPLDLFKDFLLSEHHFLAIAKAVTDGRVLSAQTSYTHEAYIAFKQLCKKEKTSSFLTFWQCVEDFKDSFVPRSRKSRMLIQHVMDEYIRSQRLPFLTKHMKDEIEGKLSDPNPDIFDDAQAVAFHTMCESVQIG